MSGLRAVPAVAQFTPEKFIRTLATLCETHGLKCGSAKNLAAFLQALQTDKHLAMEFWSGVARFSDEQTGLSVTALNGAVLEAVTETVAGSTVAQMMAESSESRRVVGALGGLLAGDEFDPPAQPAPMAELLPAAGIKPVPAARPVPLSTGAHETAQKHLDDSEVDRLRADVEGLKAAFASRFGVEAPLAAVAPETHVTPAPASVPTLAEMPKEEIRHEPVRPGEDLPPPVPSHRAVYAEAQAMAMRERAAENPVPAEAQAAPAAVRAAAVPFPVPVVERKVTAPTVVPAARGMETPRGALKANTVQPKLRLSEPAMASAAATVAEEQMEAEERGTTSRWILLGGFAVLLLVIAVFAYRWIGARPAKTAAADNASASTPAAVGVTSAVPAAAAPAKSAARVAALPATNRSKTAQVATEDSIAEPSYVAATQPAKISRVAKDEAPAPVMATPVLHSAGNTALPGELMASAPAPVVRAAAPAASSEGTGAAAPIVRTAPAPPVRVSTGVVPGVMISGRPPQYPEFAKSAHISGSVVIQATITKAGRVLNPRPISGPKALQSSALDAVRTWRYKPYLVNGVPADVDTQVVVRFSYKD